MPSDNFQYYRFQMGKIIIILNNVLFGPLLRAWLRIDLYGWVQGGSLGSFSTDICRLLQLCEEEDDASSPLAVPKIEPSDHNLQTGCNEIFHEVRIFMIFWD